MLLYLEIVLLLLVYAVKAQMLFDYTVHSAVGKMMGKAHEIPTEVKQRHAGAWE